MEIHQIKYFLAVSRSMNFTRAAEECHVTQPALTRAIQALEAELGGPLIQRERRTSHLTDLGRRMLPLLQRCYDSALSAKELARAVVNADIAPVRIALSHTVNIERLLTPIGTLFRTFPKTQLSLAHGGGSEILTILKDGDADLAIAGPLGEGWDRLDEWFLWEDRFVALVGESHPLANKPILTVEDIGDQALVGQVHCERRDAIASWLSQQGVRPIFHDVVTQHTVAAFVEAGLGVAFAPESVALSPRMRALPVEGLNMTRRVCAYAAAGRARNGPCAALLSLLRACQDQPRAAA